MKTYKIILPVLLCFSSIIHGQVDPSNGKAVFEDIEWPSGNTFRVNTKDASLKLAYSHSWDTDSVGPKKPLIWGVDLSGKTNDGILPLFAEGTFTPGFKINATIGGYTHYSLKSTNAWWGLTFGYEGSKLKLINLQ
jgi:hypothetical protein